MTSKYIVKDWFWMDKMYGEGDMNLTDANKGEEYIIKEIVTDDEELNAFLFSLSSKTL